jgi:hypothetical protein
VPKEKGFQGLGPWRWLWKSESGYEDQQYISWSQRNYIQKVMSNYLLSREGGNYKSG